MVSREKYFKLFKIIWIEQEILKYHGRVFEVGFDHRHSHCSVRKILKMVKKTIFEIAFSKFI